MMVAIEGQFQTNLFLINVGQAARDKDRRGKCCLDIWNPVQHLQMTNPFHIDVPAFGQYHPPGIDPVQHQELIKIPAGGRGFGCSVGCGKLHQFFEILRCYF